MQGPGGEKKGGCLIFSVFTPTICWCLQGRGRSGECHLPHMAFNNSCVCCSATSAFCTVKCNWASLGLLAGDPQKNNNTHTYLVADRHAHVHKYKYHEAGGGMDELNKGWVKQDSQQFVAVRSQSSPREEHDWSLAVLKTTRHHIDFTAPRKMAGDCS